jgi:hypothetical protein
MRYVAIAGLAAVLLSGSAPAAAGSQSPHIYGGTLGANAFPIVVKTDGRRVTEVVMQWTAPCTSGSRLGFHRAMRNRGDFPSEGLPPMTVGRVDIYDGAISKAGKFSVRVSGALALGPSRLGMLGGRLKGTLRPGSATGTFSAYVAVGPLVTSLEDVNPDDVMSCDTGTMKWSGTRGPLLYAGSSSQNEPVVAYMTRNGKSIKRLLVGWYAEGCHGPGTGMEYADETLNYDVGRSGAFADQFTWKENWNAESALFTYGVRGTVRPKQHSISGDWNVSLQISDAAGNAIGSCSTPEVSWSARSG